LYRWAVEEPLQTTKKLALICGLPLQIDGLFNLNKMENKLTTVTQLPLTEVMSIGKAFAESGMFSDTKSAAQAIVKIQAGQEIGIPPFAAMTGIHIIQGKPTIGAGLIASRVKGSGKYDYRVTQQDEKLCSIDFYQGVNKIGTSVFTIEDARKAGTKNLDKFPKNMLFARAISNGVKWFCPDVFSGPVYVPEEMGMDINTDDNKEPEPAVKQPLSTKAFESCVKGINEGKIEEVEAYLANWSLTPQQQTAIDLAIKENGGK